MISSLEKKLNMAAKNVEVALSVATSVECPAIPFQMKQKAGEIVRLNLEIIEQLTKKI